MDSIIEGGREEMMELAQDEGCEEWSSEDDTLRLNAKSALASKKFNSIRASRDEACCMIERASVTTSTSGSSAVWKGSAEGYIEADDDEAGLEIGIFFGMKSIA
ncbi:hypothetical protein H4Q26_008862 [Puccinia striiformis f. sp. tritici PST-130]|nr:hypothetical protein H4Q26_008862 [Puccinia striiformis f. sp. tritici PST-130]